MEDRHSKDGRPFYCAECGLGFGEFLACEEPDCRLETDEEAAKRAPRRVAKPSRPRLAAWAEQIVHDGRRGQRR